jgi:hypothetical protein
MEGRAKEQYLNALEREAGLRALLEEMRDGGT